MAWNHVADEDLLEEAADLAEDLIASGGNEEKVVVAVAEFLDAILPLDAVLPAPWGDLAEEADGPILHKGVETLVAWLKKLMTVDPEKKAERKARRAERKAARQERREARNS